jgi:hypothetical protein
MGVRPTTARTFFAAMLLAVCFLLLAHFIGSRAYAFYYPEDEDCRTDFQTERRLAPPQEGNSFLVVYDNLNCASRSLHEEAAVFPYSGDFVQADVIERNIPIRLKLRMPAQLDGDLEKRLFVDMELKKLIEEYKALRQQAKALLEALSDPASEARVLLSEQVSEREPVYEEMVELEQKIDLLSAAGADLRNAQSPDMEDPLSSFAGQGAAQGGREGSPPGVDRREHAGLDSSRLSHPGLEDPLMRAPMDHRPRDVNPDESLPWLFRAALGSITFIIAHRIDIAIFGSIIVLGIIVVAYGNSRRR